MARSNKRKGDVKMDEPAPDPSAIGSADDVAAPESANADIAPPEADEIVEAVAAVPEVTPAVVPLPAIDPPLAAATRPMVRIDWSDYVRKPGLLPVQGHLKRKDFQLDHESAARLNQIWGAMEAAGVVGPDGVLVNKPERALAVIIHAFHDAASR